MCIIYIYKSIWISGGYQTNATYTLIRLYRTGPFQKHLLLRSKRFGVQPANLSPSLQEISPETKDTSNPLDSPRQVSILYWVGLAPYSFQMVFEGAPQTSPLEHLDPIFTLLMRIPQTNATCWLVWMHKVNVRLNKPSFVWIFPIVPNSYQNLDAISPQQICL